MSLAALAALKTFEAAEADFLTTGGGGIEERMAGCQQASRARGIIGWLDFASSVSMESPPHPTVFARIRVSRCRGMRHVASRLSQQEVGNEAFTPQNGARDEAQTCQNRDEQFRRFTSS